jgi:hypothetical protein
MIGQEHLIFEKGSKGAAEKSRNTEYLIRIFQDEACSEPQSPVRAVQAIEIFPSPIDYFRDVQS